MRLFLLVGVVILIVALWSYFADILVDWGFPDWLFDFFDF